MGCMSLEALLGDHVRCFVCEAEMRRAELVEHERACLDILQSDGLNHDQTPAVHRGKWGGQSAR